MTPLVPIDAGTLVAGQISTADFPAIAAAGVSTIVNNRPDGEEPGQPAGAEIEAAARAAGIDYRHIPFSGVLSSDQVEGLAGPARVAAAPRRARGAPLTFSGAGGARGRGGGGGELDPPGRRRGLRHRSPAAASQE